MEPDPLTRAQPPVDPNTFRSLLGCFATGVTVVTTYDRAGRPAGMTASAVASASIDPPLVLVCVDHAADFHAAMDGASHFTVNVLAAEQETISERFASRSPDKFDGVPFTAPAGEPPRITGAVAHIVCERWQQVVAGDHSVFVGRVIAGDATDEAPLLYHRGGYRRLP